MKNLIEKLKKLLGLSKKSVGFTLIELLVVIGILGVLAAALVATIDPFEQLKKAQDTNTTNALVEYVNGITRYYTTHTAYPWDTVVNNGAACNAAAAPSASVLTQAGLMGDCTLALIGDHELKDAFKDSTSLKLIYVTQDVPNNQTIACFNPASKSILHNSNTKYDSAGAEDLVHCDTTAHKDANSLICYWCTR